jgi:hypothetical protein
VVYIVVVPTSAVFVAWVWGVLLLMAPGCLIVMPVTVAFSVIIVLNPSKIRIVTSSLGTPDPRMQTAARVEQGITCAIPIFSELVIITVVRIVRIPWLDRKPVGGWVLRRKPIIPLPSSVLWPGASFTQETNIVHDWNTMILSGTCNLPQICDVTSKHALFPQTSEQARTILVYINMDSRLRCEA